MRKLFLLFAFLLAQPVWAAFPTVVTAANSVQATDSTSHTVSLPSGIVSGDLLIGFFSCDGTATVTWPNEGTDWIEIVSNASVANRLSIAWRKADGTEGASITVTTSASEESVHIVYRITGHIDPSTQPPEQASTTGSGVNPNPPDLTPTGGAKDYLWFAIEGSDDDDLVTVYPTSYTDGETYGSSTGGGDCGIGAARRELNAASENPGAFTIAATEQWVAATIAVHPVAAGADDDLMILARRGH